MLQNQTPNYSVPADPEWEGSAEELGSEDAEHGGEEPKEHRSGGLEEDGVGQTESESESVDGNVERDCPYP